MKIVAQVIALYGKDFIGPALRAVAPFVDEVLVFLTDQPSHGTESGLRCPDSPAEMVNAIRSAGIGDKLNLIEGRWRGEGEHRDAVYSHVSEGDLIIVTDADEVWQAGNLAQGIALMKESDKHWYKVRMTNLWRSFDFACTDPMMQDRIIKVNNSSEIVYSPFSSLPNNPDIWHFGYARKPDDIRYKLSCHGHIGSIFSYWYTDKFLAWRPDNGITDCHPDCLDFWHPKPFDKTLLPEELHTHPYYRMELIDGR